VSPPLQALVMFVTAAAVLPFPLAPDVSLRAISPSTALEALRSLAEAPSNSPPPPPADKRPSSSANSSTPLAWTHSAEALKQLVTKASPNTDKISKHGYHVAYHALLSPMARAQKKIKLLEIGLGCNMPGGPGGSVLMWQAMFPPGSLDLHVMEYDWACAKQWAQTFDVGHRVTLHSGDQSNQTDLRRMLMRSPGQFDVIIDDGSHHSLHQITTLQYLCSHLADDGVYVVEDTASSCISYAANEPGPGHSYDPTTGKFTGKETGGTSGCMTLKDGTSSFYGTFVVWQAALAQGIPPYLHYGGLKKCALSQTLFFPQLVALKFSPSSSTSTRVHRDQLRSTGAALRDGAPATI
jgi:hypothetical protein